MTLQDMTGGKPVPGEPPLAPAWAYVALTIMTLGVVVALAVYARQLTHIAEGRATAEDVHAIAGELGDVKAEVKKLRDFTNRLESEAQDQGERIDAVEEMARP